MESVVFKMWYDGSWKSIEDGNMEYENGKARAFIAHKDITFEQLTIRVYELLGINSDEYNITMKTILKSNCPTQRFDTLPIDIVDDEMVQVLILVNSNAATDGFTPIFVTSSPKVPMQAHVIPTTQTSTFDNGTETIHTSPGFPTWTSSQDRSFRFDDVPIDDNCNTAINSSGEEIFDFQPHDNDSHCNSSIDHGKDLHRSKNDNKLCRNRSITPRARYNRVRTSADTLQVESQFENLGAIYVGQVFNEKNVLYVELSKFAISKKFEFKVAKSTKTRFNVHCASNTCKWRFRATRLSDSSSENWVVMRCDNVEFHTCHKDTLHNSHRQARSRVVGHMIKDKFIDGRQMYTPKDIISDICDDHSVKLSYQQAYRAKKVALGLLHGSACDDASRRTVRCGRCNERGHNRKKCRSLNRWEIKPRH